MALWLWKKMFNIFKSVLELIFIISTINLFYNRLSKQQRNKNLQLMWKQNTISNLRVSFTKMYKFYFDSMLFISYFLIA